MTAQTIIDLEDHGSCGTGREELGRVSCSFAFDPVRDVGFIRTMATAMSVSSKPAFCIKKVRA